MRRVAVTVAMAAVATAGVGLLSSGVAEAAGDTKTVTRTFSMGGWTGSAGSAAQAELATSDAVRNQNELLADQADAFAQSQRDRLLVRSVTQKCDPPVSSAGYYFVAAPPPAVNSRPDLPVPVHGTAVWRVGDATMSCDFTLKFRA